MRPQAEYWKVEEHEPVKSRLRVERSPSPTRLKRWNADMGELYVGILLSNVFCKCMVEDREPWGERSQTMESASTCGKQGQRLRSATSPICLSPACELGKVYRDAKGMWPRCSIGWRSPCSSLSQGKPVTRRRGTVQAACPADYLTIER
jgi:hypothetical protein